MDGTALGILGIQPNYIQNTEHFSSVPRMPDKQYLMRKPKLRTFADFDMVVAKYLNANSRFTVSLKATRWKKREYLTKRLLKVGDDIYDEAYLPARILSTFFYLCA